MNPDARYVGAPPLCAKLTATVSSAASAGATRPGAVERAKTASEPRASRRLTRCDAEVDMAGPLLRRMDGEHGCPDRPPCAVPGPGRWDQRVEPSNRFDLRKPLIADRVDERKSFVEA